MFGEFGVGLFAQAGWISQEQELGAEHSGRCFRAHQNCFYGSKPREAPMLSDPKHVQDPREKLGCAGASDGTQPTIGISKGTGMSHTGKLFSRMALLEGTYNNHLAQVPTAFFDRSIHVAEVTHTVLLPVISWADKQQPKQGQRQQAGALSSTY